MAKNKAKTKGEGGQTPPLKNHQRQLHLALACILVFSAVFLSTSIILYIGLIPAFVAFFIDTTPGKAKAVTVASFNLMGCMPFMLELWSSNGGLDHALGIILDPLALVIIYAASGCGYIVDWAVSLTVSKVLYQKGLLRKKDIQKRQEKLLERWGEGVASRGA